MCIHRKVSDWCHVCRPVNALYYAIIRRHNLYFKGKKNHYEMMGIKDRQELYEYLSFKFYESNPDLILSECLQKKTHEIDHFLPIGKKLNGLYDINRCDRRNLNIILRENNRRKGGNIQLIPLHLIPF
jgi:hypothetical protein